MKTRLSELIDGELEAREARVVLDAVKSDAELRARWQEYQLTGDILRGEKWLDSDVTARVMAALDDEPVVLAPRRQRQPWQRTALALAATLAGVAAVGWVALGPQGESTPVERTAQAPASAPAQQATRQDAADMREYLVAHQAQSSSLQFHGGAGNIRTVATGAVPSR